MTAVQAERLTWSIEEVALLLGIGRTAAYAAAARGDFPILRVGRRCLVPKAALAEMLACAGTAAGEVAS